MTSVTMAANDVAVLQISILGVVTIVVITRLYRATTPRDATPQTATIMSRLTPLENHSRWTEFVADFTNPKRRRRPQLPTKNMYGYTGWAKLNEATLHFCL